MIWLPTERDLVIRMLKLADVGPDDLVVDLGAGDGRVPIVAAQEFGARARGIEYEPELVEYANCLVAAERLQQRVQIVHGDVFQTQFEDATVLTLYLLPELNVKLRPRILAMRPGTRVVSHRFDMGEWRPDDRVVTREGTALLWIVPARLAGPWRVRGEGAEFGLVLEQRYQEVSGSVRIGSTVRPLAAARLRGDTFRFAFFDGDGRRREFEGRVRDDRLELREQAFMREGAAFVGTRG